jgi:hypothetical protein
MASGLDAWLASARCASLRNQLDELGVEEPLDLLDLKPEDIAALVASLKKVPAGKFSRQLKELQEGGQPEATGPEDTLPQSSAGVIPEGVPTTPQPARDLETPDASPQPELEPGVSAPFEPEPALAPAAPSESALSVPLVRSNSLNDPGAWDAMISYTQRNARAMLLAAELYASLRERGKTVWLDVKMPKLNTAAMKEAAQNSKCIIAVVSGAEREGDPEDSAYFKREFCVNELRWARVAGVPIQPVIMREDKDDIGRYLGQAPADLQDLGQVDFKTLDRVGPAIWNTSIDELIKSMDDLIGVSSEPEPEQEDGSGLRRIHSGDGTGPGKSDSALTIFGSMRFPVPAPALQLQAALKQLGPA